MNPLDGQPPSVIHFAFISASLELLEIDSGPPQGREKGCHPSKACAFTVLYFVQLSSLGSVVQSQTDAPCHAEPKNNFGTARGSRFGTRSFRCLSVYWHDVDLTRIETGYRYRRNADQIAQITRNWPFKTGSIHPAAAGKDESPAQMHFGGLMH